MRYLIISFIIPFIGYYNLNGQSFELIYGCSDSSLVKPVDNILVLEPLVQYDVQVIKNTIQSVIKENNDNLINFKIIDSNPYIEKSNKTVTVNLKKIVNANIESDAVLVIQYVLAQTIGNNNDSYNYSRIYMYLYNNKCELIAVSSSDALSGDSFGITRNPLKGVEKATYNSLDSIIEKIIKYNKNLLKHSV